MMRNLRYVWLLAAVVMVVAAGCSDEQTTAPQKSIGFFHLTNKSIGPSEIVLCVDVSDSISTDELQAVTGALQGCLADADLIPPDGNVSLSLVVYADTIASVIKPSEPVTATSLQDVILPALAGLPDDRLVAGGGFDLAGALDEAFAILGDSSVPDQHVLIVGSGFVDDATAVEAACTALGEAGVMISALAVGADQDGAALLEGCVQATGGFHGESEGELEPLCAEALRYMLRVEIDLAPESAELNRSEEHTLTAAVFRGGDSEAYPQVGRAIDFSVIAGPNAGLTASDTTGAAGQAAFTYTGDGGPGIDTIVALTVHPGTGVTLGDTATVTWLNNPPLCDAGGPYDLVVQTDTAQLTLDGSGSTDADGDALSFQWSLACGDALFDDATVQSPVLTLSGDCLCVDSLIAELTVSDGFDSSVCEAVIRIEDRRPPVVETIDEPLWTWPPNHRHQAFEPGMFILSATDACGNPIDAATIAVVSVTSDEPENELGDGSTVDDIMVQCPNTVMLRAERAGGRNGRVYTIVYRISDENGDNVDVEVHVAVPHDTSGRQAVLDEGTGYTYTPDCGGAD
jgi:hypothetical protein